MERIGFELVLKQKKTKKKEEEGKRTSRKRKERVGTDS